MNVGTMKNLNLNLKSQRKKLKLQLNMTIWKKEQKKRIQSSCSLEEYILFYPDGKEALFLPGITNIRFSQGRIGETVFPDSSLLG